MSLLNKIKEKGFGIKISSNILTTKDTKDPLFNDLRFFKDLIQFGFTINEESKGNDFWIKTTNREFSPDNFNGYGFNDHTYNYLKDAGMVKEFFKFRKEVKESLKPLGIELDLSLDINKNLSGKNLVELSEQGLYQETKKAV